MEQAEHQQRRGPSGRAWRVLAGVASTLGAVWLTLGCSPAKADDYTLKPVEERPGVRVPCAVALTTPPLPDGKRAVDSMSSFGTFFGQIIEASDCKREQILEYIVRIGGRRQQPPLVSSDGTHDYFLLNTYKNPWYLFWWPEYLVVLEFDNRGNLVLSNWGGYK